MATKPLTQVAQQSSAPQHFVPPTARELRAQAVHRLQLGMFGLASMLLLVGLANIIMDRARLTDAAGGTLVSSPASAPAVTSDPLGDIGLAPAADPSATTTTGAATGNAVPPR